MGCSANCQRNAAIKIFIAGKTKTRTEVTHKHPHGNRDPLARLSFRAEQADFLFHVRGERFGMRSRGISL